MSSRVYTKTIYVYDEEMAHAMDAYLAKAPQVLRDNSDMTEDWEYVEEPSGLEGRLTTTYPQEGS